MQRVTFAATAALAGNTLRGVAHAFGQRTLVGNRYIEFAKTAFDAALQKSDVRGFLNHNTDLLLGRQSSGTLRVQAESDGLHFEIDLPDTTYANDLKVLMERGDLNEMSFGIFPDKVTRLRAADGKQVELHTSVKDLFDISPVALPAFSGTSVQLHGRSIESESIKSQLVKARQRARQTGDCK